MSNSSTSAAPPVAGWLRLLPLGFVAFLLGLGLQLTFARQGFERGWEAYMALYFQERFATSWNEQGFCATAGRPLMQLLPTEPVENELYANHPPLAHWLIYLGTKAVDHRELGLRLAGLFFSSLTCGFLTMLVARRRGRAVALGTLLLHLATPGFFFYGRMANYEAFALFFGCLASYSVLELRGRRGIVAAAIFIFLMAFTDWIGIFLAVSIALLALRRRGEAFHRGGILLAAGLAAFSLYGLILSCWAGSPMAAWSLLKDAAVQGHDAGDRGLGWRFLGGQYAAWRAIFGLPLGVALLIGLVVACIRLAKGRARLEERLVVIWTFTTILWILAFPARARIHDFWLIYATPAVFLAAASVLSFLQRRNPWLVPLAVIAVLIPNIDTIRERHALENDGWNDAMTIWADETFGEDTVVVTYMVKKTGTWQERAKPVFYLGARTEEEGLELIGRFARRELRCQRLAFWYPDFVDRIRKPEIDWLVAHGAHHESRHGETILILDHDVLETSESSAAASEED